MCKIYKILYTVIPIKKWKSAVIRRHFERCPICAEEIDFKDQAVSAFFKPDWIQETPDLWPQIRPKIISHENRPGTLRPKISPWRFQARKWSLATAAAAFLFLGLIGFFLLRQNDHKMLGPESSFSKEPAALIPRVQVISAELGGMRAKAYIYQTPMASFIWIAPSKEPGELK